NAAGRENLFSVDHKGGRQFLHDAFRRTVRVTRLFDLIEQNGKFVASHARQGERRTGYARHSIGLSQASLEALGDANQQLIAREMSHRVVDHLEAVQIEKENREHPLWMPL